MPLIVPTQGPFRGALLSYAGSRARHVGCSLFGQHLESGGFAAESRSLVKTRISNILFGTATMLLAGGVATADTPHVSRRASAELFFEFDSARLGAQSSAKLAPMIQYAKDHPSAKLVLDGHADPVGDSAYNTGLSMRRAENVRDRLVMAGLGATQIIIGVYGEDAEASASHAGDRRVSVWTTEQPLAAIVDDALVSGTAVIWTKPVTASALANARSIQIAL